MNAKYLKLLSLLFFIAVLLLGSCRTDSSTEQGYDLDRDPNTMIIRQESEPDILNPMCTGSGYATDVFVNIFQPLMEYHPQTLEYVPVMVKNDPEETPVEDGPYAGGVKYTYEILQDATWDDGTPITARDYIFTVKAALNPKVEGNRWRGYLTYIKDVKIDSGNVRKFTVTVYPKFSSSKLISSNFVLYPAHVYDPDGLLDNIRVDQLSKLEDALALAEEDERLQQFAEGFNSEKYARDPEFVKGSGPYALKNWETGQRIVLERKSDWWGDQYSEEYDILRAYPEQLVFEPVPDPATTAAKVKAQELDLVAMPPSKELVDLKENELVQKNYEFLEARITEIYWIPMNTKSPVLSDKRVRRAVAHLIDIDQILEDLSFGMGERLVGPVHPSRSYHNDELQPVEFSVDKANALLDAAGWTDSDDDGIRDKMIDGQKTDLTIRYYSPPTSPVGKPVGLLLQENAKRAGIDIDIQYKEFKVIQRLWKERDFDMAPSRARRSPSPFDPYQRYHSSSDRPDGSNFMGFGDAASDLLIEKIRFAAGAEKEQAYLDFQEKVYEEQPAIYLYSPVTGVVVHKRFDAWASTRRPGYFPQYYQLKEAE